MRFCALPVPPPLDGSRQALKQKIRDIEDSFSKHKESAFLDDEEARQLTQELDELLEALSKPSQDEPDIGNKCDEEDEEAESHKTDTERRLALKKEIREIEKQLKAHKRKSCLHAKQLADLMEQMARLQGRLLKLQGRSERAKAQKTVLMAFQLHRTSGGEDSPLAVVSAADRVSLAGLSESEVSDLFSCLTESCSAGDVQAVCQITGSWDVRRHQGLNVGVLRGTDKVTLAQELERLASQAPHLVLVGTASLRVRGGVCAALRDFQGAVVVAEEPWACPEADGEAEAVRLANAVGVAARWRAGPAALQPAALPPPLRGEALGDLRLRDVREDPTLAPLLTQMEPLYQQEFNDDMYEVCGVEGVRLGILVSVLPDKAGAAKVAASGPRELLGFIIYKYWGPPLKAMSILRVAVLDKFQMLGFGRQLLRWAIERARQKPRHMACDRVSLSAIPKAVSFYERLGFVPIPDEDAPPDDIPEVQGTLKMEYRCGQAQKKTGRR